MTKIRDSHHFPSLTKIRDSHHFPSLAWAVSLVGIILVLKPALAMLF